MRTSAEWLDLQEMGVFGHAYDGGDRLAVRPGFHVPGLKLLGPEVHTLCIDAHGHPDPPLTQAHHTSGELL